MQSRHRCDLVENYAGQLAFPRVSTDTHTMARSQKRLVHPQWRRCQKVAAVLIREIKSFLKVKTPKIKRDAHRDAFECSRAKGSTALRRRILTNPGELCEATIQRSSASPWYQNRRNKHHHCDGTPCRQEWRSWIYHPSSHEHIYRIQMKQLMLQLYYTDLPLSVSIYLQKPGVKVLRATGPRYRSLPCALMW